MRPTKLEEAIRLLKTAGGLKVERLADGKFFVYRPPLYCPPPGSKYDPKRYCHTAREVIKMAKAYTGEDKQKTAIKKSLKEQSKRERAFVRDNLRAMGDEADTNYPRQKFSDQWNWD